MTAAARLAAFAAALAVLFGAAYALGGTTDPDVERAAAPHGAQTPAHAVEREHAAPRPRGLALAADGLRLELARTRLRAGTPAELRFRIVDEEGQTVRDFDVAHERRMHVLAVRRDFAGYRHLHPRLQPDGSWITRVRLSSPGSYRLFTDFTRGGKPHTLGADLTVPGRARAAPLPPRRDAVSAGGGYTVRRESRAGRIRFTVEREGRPVRALQPYLGARGHLVVLREGDLAFLHVHPEDQPRPGAASSYAVEYPSPGRYVLFLQFRHEGEVRTAAFTEEAGDGHGA